MGYRSAALELAEIARRYGLLGDGPTRTLLRVMVLDDDPELQKEAEAYIGIRALNTIFSTYRRTDSVF